jgi:hypothetical protein
MISSRVARFILIQHTKTDKNIPNDPKRYQMTLKYKTFWIKACLHEQQNLDGPCRTTPHYTQIGFVIIWSRVMKTNVCIIRPSVVKVGTLAGTYIHTIHTSPHTLGQYPTTCYKSVFLFLVPLNQKDFLPMSDYRNRLDSGHWFEDVQWNRCT